MVTKAAFNQNRNILKKTVILWNENETNRTNHRRLASRKGGVWKNESLSESFGSRWASKVKINAYYKKMKVFFDLHVNLLLGTTKTKVLPFHYP